MGELEGKVAVITGAGPGMARASTRVFVREGARVLAAAVSGREEAEELARLPRLRSGLVHLGCDHPHRWRDDRRGGLSERERS